MLQLNSRYLVPPCSNNLPSCSNHYSINAVHEAEDLLIPVLITLL